MIPFLLIAILVLRLIIAIVPGMSAGLQQLWKRIRIRTRSGKGIQLFDNTYIEVRALYKLEFNQVPCISFVNNLDAGKVFSYIREGNCGKVIAVYQRNWYNWQMKRQEFSKTIFKLSGRTIIELGDDYAEILFDKNNFDYANKLVAKLIEMKAPAKEQPFEINIITLNSNGLELKQLAIKPGTLDLDMYYNDDFIAVDKIIRDRLAKENDKGIVLLHGLPGTGKTTYLRFLIGNLKKKVLFVSPGVAGNLMNPEFIDLLIDNPNAVLVIEDAENIIMDRKYNSDSSVSNLLNISDGLLSDCLNVQIICTVNSSLNLIDSALLRKGRLIAKYEFGKLDMYKARNLSAYLGLDQEIDRAMTLAEITNPGETFNNAPRAQVIGFRREVMET